MQSTMLAGNSGGIALAVDIEMGFTDRLFAAPISRFASSSAGSRGPRSSARRQPCGSSRIGLIFGARIEDGLPGAMLLIIP